MNKQRNKSPEENSISDNVSVLENFNETLTVGCTTEQKESQEKN